MPRFSGHRTGIRCSARPAAGFQVFLYTGTSLSLGRITLVLTEGTIESLMGTLHHVCKVIPPGWSFLRRMINFLVVFRSPKHPIRHNDEFHRDLAWWLEFFTSWDGVSFFHLPSITSLHDLSRCRGFCRFCCRVA